MFMLLHLTIIFCLKIRDNSYFSSISSIKIESSVHPYTIHTCFLYCYWWRSCIRCNHWWISFSRSRRATRTVFGAIVIAWSSVRYLLHHWDLAPKTFEPFTCRSFQLCQENDDGVSDNHKNDDTEFETILRTHQTLLSNIDPSEDITLFIKYHAGSAPDRDFCICVMKKKLLLDL